MIGKAKAISYGINAIRYIKGESQRKKHPELITHVCDRFMPSGMDAMGIWLDMKMSVANHPNIKNTVLHMEVSPAIEHTKDFTTADWQELWNEFAEEFDKQIIHDDKGNVISPKTNISGSKQTVWLHEESESGVPHLHAAVCRVDEDGNINNDHQIHLRAQRAAEAVARKRGWKTAQTIRKTNIQIVSEDCMAVLKSMPQWSWDVYVRRLEAKGYDVRLRTDKGNVVRGYVLRKGNAKYKASELGTGRNLMASKIESTWAKLHLTDNRQAQRPVQRQTFTSQSRPSLIQRARIDMELGQHSNFIVERYTAPAPGRNKMNIEHDGKDFTRYIPNDIVRFFDDEFDYREVANWKPLTNLAMAYFTMLAVPDVAPSGGGGGSSSDQGWGRDKDEDEKDWARRCAQTATAKLGRKPKSGYRR